jgi:hypothetical protein
VSLLGRAKRTVLFHPHARARSSEARAPPYGAHQASLFRLYELAALATAAAGEEQPRLLELLAALSGEVAPGGEEHVYWARRYR